MKSKEEMRGFEEQLNARYVRPFGAAENFTRFLTEKIIHILVLLWVVGKKEEASRRMIDILEAGRQIAEGKSQEDLHEWWAELEGNDDDDRYKKPNKVKGTKKKMKTGASKGATNQGLIPKTGNAPRASSNRPRMTVPPEVWKGYSAQDKKAIMEFRSIARYE
jgi:hypothetical protein